MYKLFLASLAATIVFSASVFATGFVPMGNIGQTEGFSLYGTNYASQVGTHATSSSGNMATVGQNNNLTELWGPKLIQNEGSVLLQGANTSGNCGSLSVQQIGESTGTQGQALSNIGCFNMTSQGQTLGSGLQQSIIKDGGNGTATGTQSSIADQCQTILNGRTIMNSSQTIGAVQTGTVTGNGRSDGSAGGLIDITATQTQMAK